MFANSAAGGVTHHWLGERAEGAALQVGWHGRHGRLGQERCGEQGWHRQLLAGLEHHGVDGGQVLL
jgi:hypothetical protein